MLRRPCAGRGSAGERSRSARGAGAVLDGKGGLERKLSVGEELVEGNPRPGRPGPGPGVRSASARRRSRWWAAQSVRGLPDFERDAWRRTIGLRRRRMSGIQAENGDGHLRKEGMLRRKSPGEMGDMGRKCGFPCLYPWKGLALKPQALLMLNPYPRFIAVRGYPLTAPAMRPWLICRWKNR